jgi:hypothetical protein
MMSKVGFLAFIVGFILAIVAGIISAANGNQYTVILAILIVLGVLIGLLNITAKETMLFLLATVGLIVAGNAFHSLTLLSLGKYLDQILGYVAALMAPAAVVVAIRALWNVSMPGDSAKG